MLSFQTLRKPLSRALYWAIDRLYQWVPKKFSYWIFGITNVNGMEEEYLIQHVECRNQDTPLLKIARNTDSDWRWKSPSSQLEYDECVKLIAAGADIHATVTQGILAGADALYFSIILDKNELAELLLENGAKVNQEGPPIRGIAYTLLFEAIDRYCTHSGTRRFDMVKLLIAKGADLNCAITKQAVHAGLNALEYILSHKSNPTIAGLFISLGLKPKTRVAATDEYIKNSFRDIIRLDYYTVFLGLSLELKLRISEFDRSPRMSDVFEGEPDRFERLMRELFIELDAENKKMSRVLFVNIAKRFELYKLHKNSQKVQMPTLYKDKFMPAFQRVVKDKGLEFFDHSARIDIVNQTDRLAAFKPADEFTQNDFETILTKSVPKPQG